MVDQPDREEQYLLRVQDKALADRIRKVLRNSETTESTGEAPIDLKFSTNGGADSEARTGELVVEGQAYQVKRQDLPTVVECFKSYDNVNLVKCGDVGQVIVVPDRTSELPDGIEARHGVTPPMRDARKRRFRKSRDVDPGFMRQVEEAVLLIASGSAPEGYQFVDEEEEYVVSEDGRTGRWQACQPGVTRAEAGKPKAKRKYKRKGDAAAAEAGTSAEATQPEASAPGTSALDAADVEPSQDGGMDTEGI